MSNIAGKGDSDIAKGALAGAIGGFAGALAMSQFAGLWNATILREKRRPFLVKGNKVSMNASPQEWDSTIRVANLVAHKVLRRTLSRSQQALGATFVHFLVGAALGAAYGAAGEVYPMVRAGSGLPFGIAFWFSAVELAMPKVGLT